MKSINEQLRERDEERKITRENLFLKDFKHLLKKHDATLNFSSQMKGGGLHHSINVVFHKGSQFQHTLKLWGDEPLQPKKIGASLLSAAGTKHPCYARSTQNKQTPIRQSST